MIKQPLEENNWRKERSVEVKETLDSTFGKDFGNQSMEVRLKMMEFRPSADLWSWVRQLKSLGLEWSCAKTNLSYPSVKGSATKDSRPKLKSWSVEVSEFG